MAAWRYVDDHGGWYLITKNGRPIGGMADLEKLYQAWHEASPTQKERLRELSKSNAAVGGHGLRRKVV